MKRLLFCDTETYSEVDITKCGSFRYIEDPSTEVLLLTYAFDNEPVKLVGLVKGEPWPKDFLSAYDDWDTTIIAHNASGFEWPLFNRFIHPLPPERYFDTMHLVAQCGLPLSLGGAGEALGLSEDQAKIKDGNALIRYFSIPCKPTVANGQRTRNYPEHDEEKWSRFCEYAVRDVETMRTIYRHLEKWMPNDDERRFWCLDARINAQGVKIDRRLAEMAVAMDAKNKAELTETAVNLTGLENPKSVSQIKNWLADQEGKEFPSLNKKVLADVLPTLQSEDAKRFMDIRTELSKSSTAKYDAMLRSMSPTDDHVRGCFQFYGANRTGRFCGKLVQMQNLSKNYDDDLDGMRELVKGGHYTAVKAIYGGVADPLSQLVRTAIIPENKHKILVADFSAIEARVLAWLSGEQWVLDAFKDGKDIYCVTASQMFKVPVEKHGKNAELRQKGKAAILACIAEDSEVLTKRGLIPIQDVQLSDEMWDGNQWVRHEGVVYKGKKEVITYGGLTATKDHIVYTWEYGAIQFGDAASRRAHLIQAGAGWNGVRPCGDYKRGEEMERSVEPVLHPYKVSKLWARFVVGLRQFAYWKIKGLSKLFSAEGYSKEAGPNRQQQGVCAGESEMGYEKSAELQQENIRNARMDPGGLAIFKSGSSTKAISGFIERGDTGRRLVGRFRKKKELAGDQEVVRYARTYDIVNAGPHHRFTVSGVLVHNCGYGGGVNAMVNTGAGRMGMTEEEMQETVDMWRNANPHTVQMWKSVESAAIRCIRKKTTAVSDVGHIRFDYDTGVMFMTLPSGRRLAYWGATYDESQFHPGCKAISYMGQNQQTKKWTRIETWGGKLVENCWAGDTLVLTDSGWKKIMLVTTDDLVWDGVEFVEHGGITGRGEKTVINVNGVRCTPEHKILTTRGWRDAETCDGLVGLPVQLPKDYRAVSGEGSQRSATLGSGMRMWKKEADRYTGYKSRGEKRTSGVLRMYEKCIHIRGKENTQDVKTSGIRRLAQHGAALYRANAQGVEKLRWAWNNGMRKVETQLRELLGGHGLELYTRSGFRSDKQQRGVLPGELSLDNEKKELQQQAGKHKGTTSHRRRAVRDDGDIYINSVLPYKTRMPVKLAVKPAGLSEQVYDILNCGPRHRFTILTENGPLIVHNCVQGTARDILREAMFALYDSGYQIIAHVHDECIVTEPISSGRTYEDMARTMCPDIPWTKGLPLAAAGYDGNYYYKD